MWNYVLFSSLVLIVSLLYHCYFNSPLSIIEHPNTHYDYIIVGAGTAGCVVALRLSEALNVTVLLVEAGGYFGWVSSVPILAPVMQGTEVDWSFSTEPQMFSSRGFWNHIQKVPQGKGLGGSGQMNHLVHSFGRSEDYKAWPKGWSHADLLPYFKKVSDIMNVMSSPEKEYLAEAFLVAEESLKLNNVTLQRGLYTTKRGSRWSTFDAHLQNAWNRINLHILTNTLVSKILFKENLNVDGIKVIYKDGLMRKIFARKEVILCAGTINTPQLLLLSGIGPAEDLDKFQIPVVSNVSEVGKNLFDHFMLPVYVNLEAKVSITLVKLQTLPEVLNYFIFGRGWYATNGIMAIGRVNNSGLMLFGLGTTDERMLKPLSNYRTEPFRSLYPSYKNNSQEGFLFLTYCLQPKSRGTVTLRSTKIRIQPKIDPAYLEHYDDILCTHEAINFAIRVIETKQFREYGAKVHYPDLEECRHLPQDYRDIEYSECVMRVGALSSHHVGGTCKMGVDDHSVVDENLRVRGVNGLRIIDASVIPSPISGNPNSVLIAMAERASDLIIGRTG
ncbi:neither inactivation nor afterpotential protein G isoform X1 [Osmia bicornis bicornis]|uniref:neither inactivation nor afterpotential protein G isoform X1 n=1 Tax=Osmia bicornis bicornis TaxID=1437191 RepID=UPI0010F53F66|nr:neither inactivation nor afterpotential protein G isoform X1 [Osmia bicornis bicornis]